MPELIRNGRSGLLVAPGDLDAAVAAVWHVGELDRHAVRAHVEQRFSGPARPNGSSRTSVRIPMPESHTSIVTCPRLASPRACTVTRPSRRVADRVREQVADAAQRGVDVARDPYR